MRTSFDEGLRADARPARRSAADLRPLLGRVLAQVRATPVARHRLRRRRRAAPGRRRRARRWSAVAFGATYGPAWYRELTAALRSALAGDRAPLLRLVAEATTAAARRRRRRSPTARASTPRSACHDYPQLYDMTAAAGAAPASQYRAAVRGRAHADPDIYGPFTIARVPRLGLGGAGLVPAVAGRRRRTTRPGRPRRSAATTRDVPMLVLSAASSTRSRRRPRARWSPASSRDARQVAHRQQLPRHGRRRHRRLRGRDPAGASSRDPAHGLTPAVLACAPRCRRCGPCASYPTLVRAVPPAGAGAGIAVPAAGLARRRDRARPSPTCMDRWWNNYSGNGVGPVRRHLVLHRRPGHHASTLHDVRLTTDLAVSGTVVLVPLRPRGDREAHRRQAGRRRWRAPCAARRVNGTVDGFWD